MVGCSSASVMKAAAVFDLLKIAKSYNTNT